MFFWDKEGCCWKISRRQFVKNSLWATGTLLISPGVNLCLAGEKGEGEAFIVPAETEVMAYQDYTLTFKAGAGGIPPGGFIQYDFPTCATVHGLGSALNWSTPQIDDPGGEGFVSVNSNQDLTVDIRVLEHKMTGNLSYRIRLVANERLNSGESVVIGYSRARAQGIAQNCPFPVNIGITQEEEPAPIEKYPRVRVRGGAAAHIRVILPSIVNVGEYFKLKVVILDKYGFLSHEYRGTIMLQSEGQPQNLPGTYTFTETDQSRHVFSEIAFQQSGVFVVTVNDGTISGTSNPCWVRSEVLKNKIYWGDLHWHSKLSDGLTHPREGYAYAQKVSCLDFTALTDHDRFLDSRGYWPWACELAEEFNTPGEFIAFCAYEWTSPSVLGKGYGHRNVYYLDDGEPLFSFNEEATETPEGLWQHLADRNAFSIPHHPADGGRSVVDWTYVDEDLQPLAEIYQGAGNSEYHGAPPTYVDSSKGEPGYYIQDALASGQKIGFVASTDSHYTLPGGNPYLADYLGFRHALPALTAVYAPSLTREALLNHMSKRHTYATSGKRIIMRFTINDEAMMGDELTTAAPPLLAVRIISGDALIKQVEIIRDNEAIYSLTENRSKVKFTYTDQEFVEFDLNSTHYYYIRVVLSDTFRAWVDSGVLEYDHQAWTSPIWVTRG